MPDVVIIDAVRTPIGAIGGALLQCVLMTWRHSVWESARMRQRLWNGLKMSLNPHEFKREDYLISTDPSRLDLPWIHNYLTNEAYWAKGISFPVFQRSVENSLCFGVYYQSKQIGFGRVISDYATFSYLADVFIDEGFRGQGLGKWLVECVHNYPELQGLRRWMLITSDAHGLYQRYGFAPLEHPEKMMEIVSMEKEAG
jgi:GNAT superfamily N-acetyltransferase